MPRAVATNLFGVRESRGKRLAQRPKDNAAGNTLYNRRDARFNRVQFCIREILTRIIGAVIKSLLLLILPSLGMFAGVFGLKFMWAGVVYRCTADKLADNAAQFFID